MPSLNRVLIIGNCTRDPEMRYTPRGTPVCEIGVAVNRVSQDEAGERREEVTFIDCTLWSRLAEVAVKYLAKGSSVFVEGRLQLDSWEDRQTGQKRTKLRVVAENLQLLGPKEVRGENGHLAATQRPVTQRAVAPHDADLDVEPSDIPF